jgi:hypothetical protein
MSVTDIHIVQVACGNGVLFFKAISGTSITVCIGIKYTVSSN